MLIKNRFYIVVAVFFSVSVMNATPAMAKKNNNNGNNGSTPNGRPFKDLQGKINALEDNLSTTCPEGSAITEIKDDGTTVCTTEHDKVTEVTSSISGASVRLDASAKCPSGSALLSGGYEITAADGMQTTTSWTIIKNAPDATNNSWSVAVTRNDELSQENSKLTVFAICLKDAETY